MVAHPVAHSFAEGNPSITVNAYLVIKKPAIEVVNDGLYLLLFGALADSLDCVIDGVHFFGYPDYRVETGL